MQQSPLDDFDRQLAARVRPVDWVNPRPAGRYHLVVIGAGTAGLVAAAGAAGLGAKVALIERQSMGGDCLNYGCVPSKSLLHSARVAAGMAGGDEGIDGQRPQIDFGKVMSRMRRLRAGISHHDSAERFRDLGVDVYFGDGVFTGPQAIEVAGTRLAFRRAVIATGARAAIPAIDGLADVPVLTNESLFDLTESPKRLAVLGGGPIGCEMAQAFARLGSNVTLIERAEVVLQREDREAALLVQESLRSDGVQVLTGHEVQRVVRRDGELLVATSGGGGTKECRVDQILVALGRQPNVEGLGLERAGIELTERGRVRVNDRLQTTNRRVFAAGDVCSSYQFTHAADFMARLVIQNALFLGRKRQSRLVIPWCTYTSPELAHIGLTAEQAEERGIEVSTFQVPMDSVDRAVLEGRSEGWVKVHVRAGSDRIVGATIVGEQAGDLIGTLSLAMTEGIGLGKIASAIHPYPTRADAIRKAGDLYRKTQLTPKVKRLLGTWLRWMR